MNFKKFITMLVVLVGLVASTTFAQSTFFVNNLTGNDANSGTTAGDAKATVNSAMIAAPAGSFISVAATGVNYIEAAPTVRGTYIFTSTGGTPVFSNAFNVGVGGYLVPTIASISGGANATVTMTAVTGVKNGDVIYIDNSLSANYNKKYYTVSSVDNVAFTFKINSVAADPAVGAGGNVAARGDVTFQMPFQFNGGLNLNVGTVTGGNQVTVQTQVYRTELGSVVSGGFVYSGNINVVYANRYTTAAVTITTGFEWPTGTSANNLNTANTAGAITLKLDNVRTIGGVLTTTGPFNLNSFQFNINGNNAHTIGGAVTGTGPMYFTMNTAGAASITGAFAIANVVADDDASGTTLTINATVTNVGNVTVNNSANAVINNNGTVGNILLNGAGNITTSCQVPGVTGTVTMASTSTGNVTLNNNAAGAYTTGTITNSGIGTLTYGANVNTINVGTVGTSTNVILNTTVPAFRNAAAGGVRTNLGRILFTDFPVTIWGQVQNNSVFSGSSDQAGNNTNGLIRFANTTTLVTIKNTVLNNITGSITYTGGGGGTSNGEIQFLNSTGNLVFAGVTNQSTANVPAGNTRIVAGGGGTGSVTFTNMLNSSTDADSHIDFTLMTGNISGTTISQTGSTTGGDILLGNGTTINLTGDISNSRGAAGADIVIGTAASAASLTGKNINNSGKSNITFNSVSGAGNVNLGSGGISSTGTGTISFPNTAGAGTFAFTAFTVSNGTVDFGNGTGNISASGVVNLSAGTINFSGAAAKTVVFSNATIGIGGVGTKPTFAGNSVRLSLAQPIPNVNQIVTLGTLDNTFPGYLTVDNNAAIPAPYVFFKSIAGVDQTQPGLLYILNAVAASGNGLLFDNTLPAVTNFVQIDNARLYVGRNAPVAVNGGGFQNTGGYTTLNGGFVMMAGGVGAAQVVNGAAVNAGATFGNFGVANNSGTVPCVTFGAAGAIVMGDFYLANGSVNPTNLDFQQGSPYSTIFRTEGTFNVILPNPTSKVNVTYYGGDKTTSNEIPAGVTKLWNLTVATTNGAKPGFGIITMNGSFTVNGTLTINANQALYTAANTLTMAGASAVINGYLVDDGNLALGRFVLAAATGTVFTGAGYLPTLVIADASLGNSVTGYTGVYSQGFGADGVWGGVGGNVDDFVTADGNISYVTGAGDTGSNLTVGFIGAGPHFGSLNIGNAPVSTVGTERFTISSNTVMSGNITQGSGVIVLGDFTLTHNGTAFAMDITAAAGATVASITSTANGKLVFPTNATNLNISTAPGTIAANVSFTANGGTVTLPAYVAGVTDNLTINGNVVVNSTLGTTVAIGGGNILKLGGSSVTVGTLSLFSAPAPGTGVLDLYNATAGAGLTFTSPAATAVVNLTIDDNVTLAGSVAGGAGVLTVTTAFIHNAGLFTFGTANLQINGTFTRNGGTYAGDGWLIYNGGAAGFQHSAIVAAGTMSINNFKLTANMTLQNARNFNVVKGLWLIGGSLTNQVAAAGPGYTIVGDVTNVPMITIDGGSDVLVNALQFGNANADYTFTGASAAISTRAWPADPSTVARNVVVNKTNVNGAIAPGVALQNNTTLNSSRIITGNLTLTTGYLIWDSPVAVTMPTVGSVLTRNWTGALNYDANADGTTGTFTAANLNLVYTGVFFAEGQSPAGITPGGTGTTSGIEYSLPVVVNNFTLGTTGVAGAVTLNTARSIDGTITIGNAASVLTLNQNTTFTLAQTLATGTITVNAPRVLTLLAACTLNNVNGNVTANAALTLNGNHAAGTITASNNVTVGAAGTFAVTSNLTFVGTANATLTVPAAGSAIGAMTLNKTNNTNTVTLSGGNLALTNTLTFVNGLFLTGANRITLFVPTVAAVAAGAASQGFNRVGVTGTNASHIVGNVGKALIYTGVVGTSSEPRIEFPVGTLTLYKMAAITFNPAFGLPTNPNATILVSAADGNPGGAVGLPIKDGVAAGIDVARYPNFYWTIASTPFSIGPTTPFDLELTAASFTDFDAVANLRIIRRHGAVADVSNDWLLQGTNSSYDNSMNGTSPTIIQRGANAGLRVGGAVFTLGIKSNMSIKTAIPKQYLVLLNPSIPGSGPKNYLLTNVFKGNLGQLSFTAQTSNTAAATVVSPVVGATLTVTPVAIGDCIITVTAYDATSNDFFAYSFAVNVGLTDVEDNALPTEFALYQNFPNPFNPTTNIKFALPKESNVTLKIYNVLGQEVETLVNKVMQAGYHTVDFNATKLSSGMYIYRIEADNFVQVKKMLLMK